MTGTMTGLHAPKPGETAVADFGALGRVEVVFGSCNAANPCTVGWVSAGTTSRLTFER